GKKKTYGLGSNPGPRESEQPTDRVGDRARPTTTPNRVSPTVRREASGGCACSYCAT
ncbi:hypothetical protein PV326_000688, partial [Microctonus aethiopoides]